MSNIVSVINQDELDKALPEGTAALLFTAPAWCGPCQQLEPHFIKAADSLPDVTFIKVDIDTADEKFVEAFGIMSVPTMFRLDGGLMMGQVKGKTVFQLIRELDEKL